MTDSQQPDPEQGGGQDQAPDTPITPETEAEYRKAATNLVLVDLAISAGSLLVRNALESRFVGKGINKPAVKAMTKQGSVPGKVARAAAARMATRSVPGALAVAGGLAAKLWYDRAKRRRDEKFGPRPQQRTLPAGKGTEIDDKA